MKREQNNQKNNVKIHNARNSQPKKKMPLTIPDYRTNRRLNSKGGLIPNTCGGLP